LSKDHKLYHRYLADLRSKAVSTTVTVSLENSGSGEMPVSNTIPEIPINPVYVVEKLSTKEVEETFKAKYPLQYLQARKKFDKKLRKLLEANE